MRTAARICCFMPHGSCPQPGVSPSTASSSWPPTLISVLLDYAADPPIQPVDSQRYRASSNARSSTAAPRCRSLNVRRLRRYPRDVSVPQRYGNRVDGTAGHAIAATNNGVALAGLPFGDSGARLIPTPGPPCLRTTSGKVRHVFLHWDPAHRSHAAIGAAPGRGAWRIVGSHPDCGPADRLYARARVRGRSFIRSIRTGPRCRG